MECPPSIIADFRILACFCFTFFAATLIVNVDEVAQSNRNQPLNAMRDLTKEYVISDAGDPKRAETRTVVIFVNANGGALPPAIMDRLPQTEFLIKCDATANHDVPNLKPKLKEIIKPGRSTNNVYLYDLRSNGVNNNRNDDEALGAVEQNVVEWPVGHCEPTATKYQDQIKKYLTLANRASEAAHTAYLAMVYAMFYEETMFYPCRFAFVEEREIAIAKVIADCIVGGKDEFLAQITGLLMTGEGRGRSAPQLVLQGRSKCARVAARRYGTRPRTTRRRSGLPVRLLGQSKQECLPTKVTTVTTKLLQLLCRQAPPQQQELQSVHSPSKSEWRL